MLMIVSTATPVYTTRDLGETVRRARHERGLTQIDLAERANVARGAVQKLESGRGTVNFPTVLKVLRTLSLDLVVSSRAAPIWPSSMTSSSALPAVGPSTTAGDNG